MIFDIHKLEWSKELLEYFDIPSAMLPKVLPSSAVYGYTDSTVLGGKYVFPELPVTSRLLFSDNAVLKKAKQKIPMVQAVSCL